MPRPPHPRPVPVPRRARTAVRAQEPLTATWGRCSWGTTPRAQPRAPRARRARLPPRLPTLRAEGEARPRHSFVHRQTFNAGEARGAAPGPYALGTVTCADAVSTPSQPEAGLEQACAPLSHEACSPPTPPHSPIAAVHRAPHGCKDLLGGRKPPKPQLSQGTSATLKRQFAPPGENLQFVESG